MLDVCSPRWRAGQMVRTPVSLSFADDRILDIFLYFISSSPHIHEKKSCKDSSDRVQGMLSTLKKQNFKLIVNSRLCYHVNTGALGWRHPFLPHVDMLCERAVKMCLLAKIKKKERKNDIPGVSYYEKLSREIDFECRHTTISGQQTQRRKGTKGMA